MTNRERFAAVMAFERPDDRYPMIEWAPWWDKTIARWRDEGLPKDLGECELQEHLGLDPIVMLNGSARGSGLPAPGFHGGPIIADLADYEAVLPYLYGPGRVAQVVEDARRRAPIHADGRVLVRLWLDGFFWFPRVLLGIEAHLLAFYDQPELMHRINRDLAAFNAEVVNALVDVLKPDFVGFAEDMSYNHGPMLGRELFDEFLLPYYRPLTAQIHAAGIPVLVDSDGDITKMVPWLLDSGIDGVYPLERQAGVDVVGIRAAYPRFLMLGGYDKMVMNQGPEAIRGEFERLLPLIRSGGFVASVDHQTPPGVSLAEYHTYIEIFREYAHK